MRISTTTTSCATIRCWRCSRASSLRARGLRAGGRQVDAQPAGAEPLEPTRYHKISHNTVAIKRLFVDLFLEAHERVPNEIILDLDATTIRCTASRRGGSSTAITTATATCRFTCSAGASVGRQVAAREH